MSLEDVPDTQQGYDVEPGEKPRCAGTTRRGARCRATPPAGETFCAQHGPDDGGGDVDPVAGRGPSQSETLTSLALERYELGVATTGEPFAVAREGPRVARMLRGGAHSLRAELAATYYDMCGHPASSSALAEAVLTLEGLAMRQPKVPLALRLADHDGGVVVDLGDATGRVVVITPDGWTVEDDSPVLFRRTSLIGAFPEPVRGGTLETLLRPLLNVSDRSWPLLEPYLAHCFLPSIPHVVLEITGEHGTAKTTATRRIVALTDPGPAPVRTAPRDIEQWITAAAGSWVVALENLSGIPGWLSDAICRAVTGDGFPKRQLYTDQDLSVVAFRRCVILNGIDLGAVKGDLADRRLPLGLEFIDEDQRLEDEEAEAAFAAVYPAAFGALLDLVADVLATRPSVRPARLPRMADFARVVATVDHLRGPLPEGTPTALESYRQLTRTAQVDTIEGDSAARAIRDFAQGLAEPGRTWKGPIGELHRILTPERPPRDWPASPRGMTAAVKRAAPALRAVGVTVAHLGKSGQRAWSVTYTPPAPAPRSQDDEGQPSGPSGPSTDEDNRRSGAVEHPDGWVDGWVDGSPEPSGTVRPTVRPEDDQNRRSAARTDGPDGWDGSLATVWTNGHTPVPADYGPCVRCAQKTERYGPNGNPLCATCRGAPVDATHHGFAVLSETSP